MNVRKNQEILGTQVSDKNTTQNIVYNTCITGMFRLETESITTSWTTFERGLNTCLSVSHMPETALQKSQGP